MERALGRQGPGVVGTTALARMGWRTSWSAALRCMCWTPWMMQGLRLAFSKSWFCGFLWVGYDSVTKSATWCVRCAA